MDPVESREIRGVNINNLKGVILVIAFIVAQYFLVIGKIDKLQIWQETFEENFKERKASDDKYSDLRIRTIELNVSTLSVQLENLRNQVQDNANKLKEKE